MNSIMTEDINKETVGGGIQSKEQLKKFISEDALANDIKNNSVNYYLGLFYGLESAHAFKYLKTMRFLEYHSNNNGIWHKLWRIFYKVKLSKLGMKYNLHITPNTCGYGLQIHHIFGGGQILKELEIIAVSMLVLYLVLMILQESLSWKTMYVWVLVLWFLVVLQLVNMCSWLQMRLSLKTFLKIVLLLGLIELYPINQYCVKINYLL